MSEVEKPLFDWKHAQLWRFSLWADVLSKLVVVAYVLVVIAQIYNYNSVAHDQYQTNLLGLFSRNPAYIFTVSAQAARVFIQGLVYYLVLKGVSLGLTMIVETDINYRDSQPQEES